MSLKQYQVDAFTHHAFKGNPAAVVVSHRPLADALMRDMAAENNLSETAYVYPDGDAWNIRWFTPTVEVDLCGHATLASAWVLATEYGLLEKDPDGVDIVFNSRSGELRVRVEGESITLDFPAQEVKAQALPEVIAEGLGVSPNKAQCYKAQITNGNYIVILPDEAAVAALAPDMSLLEQVEDGGIIATAEGVEADFVSRFFGPFYGIPEDPVTGSAHCSLVPYWARVLEQNQLWARQISPRGGDLQCRVSGDRVFMTGRAVTVSETQWRL